MQHNYDQLRFNFNRKAVGGGGGGGGGWSRNWPYHILFFGRVLDAYRL